MPVPKSVTKVTKDGVEFTDSVDRCKYTLNELSRAALRDVGKYVVKETRKNFADAGIKRTGRGAKQIQYWVRKRETDLLVGIKKPGFYLGFHEMGTSKHRSIGALSGAVYNNIGAIRDIEGKYLSSIENEQAALALIDDGEYEGE